MKKKLIIFGAALLITYCVMGLAHADIAHFNVYDGKTEPANCYVEYTDPARTVCVSESFICVHFEETYQTVCTVKR